jgi:hypothetical protein
VSVSVIDDPPNSLYDLLLSDSSVLPFHPRGIP